MPKTKPQRPALMGLRSRLVGFMCPPRPTCEFILHAGFAAIAIRTISACMHMCIDKSYPDDPLTTLGQSLSYGMYVHAK